MSVKRCGRCGCPELRRVGQAEGIRRNRLAEFLCVHCGHRFWGVEQKIVVAAIPPAEPPNILYVAQAHAPPCPHCGGKGKVYCSRPTVRYICCSTCKVCYKQPKIRAIPLD